MNKWVIELPWLEEFIDLEELMKNYTWDSGNNDPWRGVSCYEITYKQKEIRRFMDMFNSNKHFSKPPTYWLTHKSAATWMSPHIDQIRDAVLIFPIEPKDHTIHFLDNLDDENSVVHSHTYRHPSIPHAKIPHCVKDLGIERYYLQISLYINEYSWNKLNDLVSSKVLFSIN
jgi:hypothetical protein